MSTLSMGSSRIWINSTDPGLSEPNVDEGNLWLNTTTSSFRVNSDATMGAQVWNGVILGSQIQTLTPGIDATSLATTTLMTTNAGSSVFCITGFLVRLTAQTVFVSPDLSVSLGFNNPTYDNILGAQNITLSAVDDYWQMINVGTTYPGVPASTDIKLVVTAAQGATTATIQTCIIGFYL